MSTRQNSTLVGGVLSATTALHSPRPSDEGPAPATAPRRKTAHGTKPGRASRAYAKHVCWVFVGTALYLTVTSAFYLLIESKPCEADNPETQERRGERDGCTERWTVVDALYFVMSSMSTVGYGDLHPSTPLSKVMTLLFVILGAGVVFYHSSLVVANAADWCEARLIQLVTDLLDPQSKEKAFCRNVVILL